MTHNENTPAHDEENRACDKNMLIGDYPCTCGATVLHNYSEGEIPNPVTPANEWREEVEKEVKEGGVMYKSHWYIKAEKVQSLLDQHSAHIVERIEKEVKVTDPDTKDHPLNELRNEVADQAIDIVKDNK